MPKPRNPRNLQLLKGETRPSRLHEEPELPPVSDVDPPTWLISPVAVQFWRELVDILQPQRILSEGDRAAMGHLANLHAAIVRKWEAGVGPTAAELTQLRLMLGEFGLTPASRSKAGQLPGGDEENPFLEGFG